MFLINGIPDIGAHEQVLPYLVQILLTLNVERLNSRLTINFPVWFGTSLLRFTVSLIQTNAFVFD